jgi:hypothetical protein
MLKPRIRLFVMTLTTPAAIMDFKIFSIITTTYNLEVYAFSDLIPHAKASFGLL